MTTALASQAVQQYERDGYYHPLQILDPDEVARCRLEEDRLHQTLVAMGNTRLSSQTHLHFRWAYDLVTDPRILDAVEGILGPDILVHSSTIFGKQPGDERFVSWHQDGYYMRLDRPDFVSAWVALTDSAADNGCLRVMPGSHRSGRLAHGETAVSEKNMLLSGMEVETEIDEDRAVDVELRPGEASLHHVDLLHGSRANTSGRPRIGVAIRYVAPHVKQATKHHVTLLARGQDRFGNYETRTPPPTGTGEEGVDSMRQLLDWILATRRAQGLPA